MARGLWCVLALVLASSVWAEAPKKLPVIFDTDIGDDIDDTWALVMLLKSPELDLKLVVTDFGKSTYRAKLVAKLLEVAQRTDVPVGLGLKPLNGGGGQDAWVKDYDLAKYPGKVHQDGVQALIDTVMGSPEKITIISVAPMPNLGEALRREPRIATKARFIGMHGSLRKGYGGGPKPAPEWNVKASPAACAACKAVFEAPWEVTITPLDTCGLVHLGGAKYAKVRNCTDPLVQAMIENYRLWCGKHPENADKGSSTLFDTVAVYLALQEELVNIETLGVVVMPDGLTKLDDAGPKIRCATSWKSLPKFEDFLVERLVGGK